MNAGETITRLRATTTTGRLGDETPDWADPDELDIDGVGIAPAGSNEDHDNRAAVTSDLDLYLPAGADLLAIDRARVRGEVYEVVGDVADWRNPLTGAHPGAVATVRRVTG